MSLLGSLGASKAGVGPPTFLVVSSCGTFQGLPYLLLKDPPVSPSEVSDVVPGVPAVTVNRWGNHTGHPLWHFILGTRGLVVGVGFYSHCPLVRPIGLALLQRDSAVSLFSPSLLYVCQISVQRSGASGEDSVTSRVLASELGHHGHVEGVPVAYQFLFGGERELGCPKGPAVISTAHITHRARVNIGPEGHLVASGLRGPPDDLIRNKFRVSPSILNDGSCCPGSSCLSRLDRSHGWLIQGDPV